MKKLLFIGTLILLKIVAYQYPAMNYFNDNKKAALNEFHLSNLDFKMIEIFILLLVTYVIFLWFRNKFKHQDTPISAFKKNVRVHLG
jgi:heme/copper-type cytochrome/quinol oxidase subunit 2